MKTFMAAVAILLASSTLLSAQSASSIQNAKRGGVQPACASTETGKGESKFNGQIYSAEAGSFQVSSGKETATVSYNNTLLVCENGQISNTGALLSGATVEVIGPMIKKGNSYVIAASKVFISGAAPASANPPGQGLGSEVSTQDSITSGSKKGNTQSSNTITCNSLQFEIGGASSAATGAGVRRTTVTPITCRRTVDQETMVFVEDAITARRLADVTLSWQGTLDVRLTNADISSVTFSSDSSGQIVEIAFAAEKAEIAHVPSGTKVSY